MKVLLMNTLSVLVALSMCCKQTKGGKVAPGLRARIPGPTAGPAACESFKTIEVAIAYDASFCAAYGSDAVAAQARVEDIVALASEKYSSARQLCVQLEISNIDGHCDQATDPYRDVISNPNLLEIFKDFWNENRTTTQRDVAHFFTGTDFTAGSSVGMAYVGTVCNLDWAYGVEYMTNTADLNTQSLVFAHGLGHNLGASHDSNGDTGHIMNSVTNSGENGFSSISIDEMAMYLASNSHCLSN